MPPTGHRPIATLPRLERVPADLIHLVRHGEVYNPDGVLYGRLPGFTLSELGHLMARAAADSLRAQGRDIRVLVASPLQRTQESAAPLSATFGRPIDTDERVIEPTNVFEGKQLHGPRSVLRSPRSWPRLINPWRPSWGEPYRAIFARMDAAMADAHDRTPFGDAVIVSHQLPIEIVSRQLGGRALRHDPRARRCALSSVTTFRRENGRFIEVSYLDPAASLRTTARDVGAV